MDNLLKFLFVVLFAIIIAVIQSNGNAIDNCKIDGNECNSDDECCGRSCIPTMDGISRICTLSTEEVKCYSHGEDCSLRNITCCNQCRINWAIAYCV